MHFILSNGSGRHTHHRNCLPDVVPWPVGPETCLPDTVPWPIGLDKVKILALTQWYLTNGSEGGLLRLLPCLLPKLCRKGLKSIPLNSKLHMVFLSVQVQVVCIDTWCDHLKLTKKLFYLRLPSKSSIMICMTRALDLHEILKSVTRHDVSGIVDEQSRAVSQHSRPLWECESIVSAELSVLLKSLNGHDHVCQFI